MAENPRIYQTPLETISLPTTPIENEENIGIEHLEDGSMLIDLSNREAFSEEFLSEDEKNNHYRNLVNDLDHDFKIELAHEIMENVENDDASRGEWLDMIEKGMDLLGLRIEEKNEPFRGACSAHHPLIMESAVKFQSKASTELLPAKGPVKTLVLGEPTAEKEKKALKIKNFMNYQLTEVMTEFYPDSERMLLAVPIVGNGFKKVYYCSASKRPVSEFVQAEQLIVPNSAPDLQRAERFTHVLYRTKNQLGYDFASGLYEKPENGIGDPQEPLIHDIQRKTSEMIGMEVGLSENDHVYTLYEHYVDIHLPQFDDRFEEEYEVASPYIITVDAHSGEILGVRRNWKANDDEKRQKKVPFSHYGFVPGFGFYNYGLLHLLGNLQMSLTAALRSLIDSGQFANLQGGFKLKGVRISGDDEPIYPGQFKDIEAGTMDINKALYPLPFKEPSQVLMQMLEFLDVKGQKFADSTEQVIADSTNYGPVGTTLALLDASTKFFSSIHKRLHLAQKNELKNIADINAETLDDEQEIVYNIENETVAVTASDFDSRVDVVPVSDPNIPSSSHRMTKAQTIFQMAQQTPEIHDMREVLRHVYINMDYEDIDKILPPPEKAQPLDPISDIQAAVAGKPIKAFPGQDHDSHIAIETAFLQDPASGGSAMMQKVKIVLEAHIQEHLLMKFQEQVKALGGDPAQAAQQIAQMNIQQMQMEQEQAKKQNENTDAAMMLAKSDLIDSMTNAKKQEFDETYKTAQLLLQKEKMEVDKFDKVMKNALASEKLDADTEKIVVQKGLDAMAQALTDMAGESGREIEKESKEIEKEK